LLDLCYEVIMHLYSAKLGFFRFLFYFMFIYYYNEISMEIIFSIKRFRHLLTPGGSVFLNDLPNTIFVNTCAGLQL